MSPINGDSREYTAEELAAGAELDDFLSGLAPKPASVEYSQDLDDSRPPPRRLRKIVRITLGPKEDTPTVPPPPPLTRQLTRPALIRSTRPVQPLQVPKTPAPPRRKYVADPSQRPTVQYTDPILHVPKNAFRAQYIQENIRLRVELEVAKRERDARSAYYQAKHIAEAKAKFREGVAAGYIKGAEAQLDTLRRCSIVQADAKRKKHNQEGYENRLAKKAKKAATQS